MVGVTVKIRLRSPPRANGADTGYVHGILFTANKCKQELPSLTINHGTKDLRACAKTCGHALHIEGAC